MRKSRKGLFRRRRSASRRQRGFTRGKRLKFQMLESRLALSTAPTLIDFDSTSVSNPDEFVTVGDLTYFVATDTSNGRELWATDGSVTGTRLVADINQGNDSSNPTELVNVDGTLYFTAFTEEDGRELWTTDGTQEGTMMVADIFGGTFTSNDQEFGNSSNPAQLTDVDGTLYFTARDGVNGVELWKSDGTAEGTELVRDINDTVDPDDSATESSNPTNLTSVDGTLFFSADDGENGEELWSSDGTESGTMMVRDIFTGSDGDQPNSSFPGLFVAKDDQLFFVANDGENGAELWMSDGTESGTEMIADINTGAEGAFVNSSQMVVLDDLLLFTANDGTSGIELWSSDGTEAGTQIVLDINDGADNGLNEFSGLTVIDDQLYFSADDGTVGAELWMSDGTTAGTALVAEINSFTYEDGTPQSGNPIYFEQVNGTVYFSAFTVGAGRELWQTDGTAEGTRLVDDYRLTTSSFNPSNLTEVDGNLFFSGQTENGSELFTLVEGDSVQLSIYVDGVLQTIPALVGVQEVGTNAEAYTLIDDGQVFFDMNQEVTLSEFFDVWRTNAGLAGNDPDAVLTSTQVLEFQTDFENTLQVFVDGQIVSDFEDYQLQGGEQIDIIYGENPVVAIVTNFGTILVELFDSQTPQTVNNFLNYVNDGDYVNSIFHRSVEDFVIQSGGFTSDSTTFTETAQFGNVPTDAPVQSEVGISNTQGTIAMATVGGDPNSGTSQFYFNLVDNSQTLDSAFTVFGQILAMTTVDVIASLPIDMTNEAPFDELPVSVEDELAVISSVEGQGELAGVAFYDLNGNGTQDANEAGIAGARVFLDTNSNGSFDEEEPSVLTDAEGRYLLQTVPGQYTLMIEPLGGATFTDPGAEDGFEVTVEIGREVSALNFAFSVSQIPTGIDLLAASDTGNSATDNLTNLNNDSDSTFDILVSGTVFGATINLFADGTLIGTAIADGSETTVTTDGTTVLPDGSFLLQATMSFGDVEGDASDSLEITIDATDPAAITTTPPETVTYEELFAYDPASADEGSQGVSYSLQGAPQGMTINPTTGEIAWTPTLDQTGPEEFTILLSDEAGNSATQVVELTVLADLPVLPDAYVVDEDETLTVSVAQGVLTNDGDAQSGSLVAEVVDLPTNGTLMLEEDGSFTYTPNDDFFGEDSFTYQASDDSETGNVAKVTITVNPQQDAPMAFGDEYTLDEDQVLTRDAADGLLSNDIDVDGDTLTAVEVSGPSNGTLELNDDGSFVYTPNEHFNGSDSFTYRVNDGTANSNTVTVALTINAVEDSPIADDDSYDVDEDGTLEVDAVEGLLANDFDPDGDDLSLDLDTPAANGSVVLQSDGSFTYTPNDDFFGTDTFTYVISDGFREAEATVTIEVAPTPDDPTAADDSLSVVINGGAQELDVLANDSTEPDGEQTLTIISVTQGAQNGEVQISEDGQSVLYTPAADFEGSDTFDYTIEDEDGLTSTATVLVSVSLTPEGVIAGVVYLDEDGDGFVGTEEVGIPGALIRLTGTTSGGLEIERTAISGSDGSYSFEELNAGNYTLTQMQPALYEDGNESSDNSAAVFGINEQGDDEISNIVVAGNGLANTFVANNFAESSVSSEYVSITWFFASNIANTDYVREVMADVEEARGNILLAEAIRNGDTTLDTEEAAASSTVVSEVFAEEDDSAPLAEPSEDSTTENNSEPPASEEDSSETDTDPIDEVFDQTTDFLES